MLTHDKPLIAMSTEKLIEYKGVTLNYNIVSDILTQLWTQLEQRNVSTSNIKKVYSVATECLENIYKHSDFETTINDSVTFNLEWEEHQVKVVARNPVDSTKATALSAKIDFIKSLNQIGLKKLYQYEIKKRSINSSGGAGLGLIIIARKSETSFEYTMKQLTESKKIVLFQLTIPLE